jgi:hypothetical protein
LPEPNGSTIFSSKDFKTNQNRSYLFEGVKELFNHFDNLMTGTHADTQKAMRRQRFASKFAPQW